MEENFNNGYETVMPQITSILLNGVMELEREKYLKAEAYARNPERISYANGYKDKKIGMRMGEVQLKIPQTRDCMFYPQTVEKGVRSKKALLWTALLAYVLLRFIAWQSNWEHTFIRLFTALRGVLWSCLDVFRVLKCCGTAGMRSAPDQCYLLGFEMLFS